VGILWLADGPSADVSMVMLQRYRPRHAVPSLPVRIMRTSQSRVQAIVNGGLWLGGARRLPRSLRMQPIMATWEPEPTPAGRGGYAPAIASASAVSTLPLPRIA
jgi:hypothetical protein